MIPMKAFTIACLTLALSVRADYVGLIGSTSNDWFDASLWTGGGGGVPTITTEQWMLTPDTLAVIDGRQDAEIKILIVGRKLARNVNLRIKNNGRLRVDQILFLGQYTEQGIVAEGNVALESGVIDVGNELSVGVSAEGNWIQDSGSTIVRNSCRFGRYNKADAVGIIQLNGGSMLCKNSMDVNPVSTLTLNGGVLKVMANYENKINGWISSNRIVKGSSGGIFRVRYNGSRTLVYQHDMNTRINHGYGYNGASSSRWNDPDNWNRNVVGKIEDELWIDSQNPSVIGENEVGMMDKLVVGRHATNVRLTVQSGGELYVGDESQPGSMFFVGQYGDSSGFLTVEGLVTVNGELAVGARGPGSMIVQGSGEVLVTRKRLVIGRNRNDVLAKGYVAVMDDSIIKAPNLAMNDFSTLELLGGTVQLSGNRVSKVQGFVDDGKIISSGVISVTYDSGADVTTLTSTVDSTSWDVAGILSFTDAEVGPIMPTIIRPSGLREFTGAPAPGVHPRIFFGPDDIPEIRQRLLDTSNPVAVEAMKQLTVYTTSMVVGRPAPGYNSLPEDVRKLPSGAERIGNAGLFGALATSYHELISGSTTYLAGQTGTHWNALGGVMAVEAFYVAVFDGVEGDVQGRAADLAAAMNTWCLWALQHPDFDHESNHRDIVGGQHMAFAYDLAYNFMDDTQRANVRKAIATMIWKEDQFVGIDTAPYATQTNWITLNSFVPMMVLAIEGDITDPNEAAGWDNGQLRSYFREIMKATYKFLTYGWYQNGEPLEGMGKNYQYNNMYIAYAKRGYNFFTHPNVQAYAFDFLLAQMQPFGHFITTYDAIGGSGWDPELGGNKARSVDVIGLKYAFPTHAAVNLAYRQYVETPYTKDGESLVQYDLSENKLTVRSTYQNSLLSMLIMCPSAIEGDFQTQNEAGRSSLTFAGMERGLIIANSDFSPEAVQLQVHVRQDMGGHTMGDRNGFLLSGLGRVWVRLPKGYLYDTEWASTILVDGQGVKTTGLDGTKARQPSKLAHFQDNEKATFVTGDATYAYNTEWYWSRKLPGQDFVRSGFSPVTATWNDFRRSGNKIPYDYGNTNFYDFDHWSVGGYLERCVQKEANDMKQVYRLAGLVRGTYPYALIVDDLEKMSGGSSTAYQWLAQIPEDLTLMPITTYPVELDPVRDVVLMEPAATGNRRLLIRILNAEGDSPNGGTDLFEFDETKTYYQWGQDRAAKRFIIERLTQKPRYRVLLYPFADGDVVPVHILSSNGDVIQDWSGVQTDRLAFEEQTATAGAEVVEITGLTITRDSNEVLIDTRGQVEPNEIRN